MEPFGVALLGCGHVGSAVARMLHEHADDIARRAGVRIDVAGVLVRDASRPRDVPVPPGRFGTDGSALIRDASVAAVVEVMGGIEPARSLILEALKAGTPVVTANKELLARHSQELFDAAAAGRTELLYEAAVGGGIPLIRPLREHLAGDRIARFMGIVNGTTNYILTRMSEDGLTADEALAEAQRLGYAESDPTADVEGFDAASKAAILASIAFDTPIVADDVHREGIGRVGAEDIAYARQLGYVVKLLAIADAADDGSISVRVHPSMIPSDHPLGSVRESFNAVFIEGERVGPLMLYGRGAGGDPTATSVVGDVIELARSAAAGGSGPSIHAAFSGPGTARRVRPIDDLASQYYLRLEVADRHGVLAAVASVFAAHEVSIKSVWQEGHGEEAQLVLVTHQAVERDLAACVRDLEGLDVVESVRSAIRVVAGEP
jgi:homoserine dehydrogenase